MPDTDTTPVVAEPQAAATPPAEAPKPEPTPQPDWEAAYKGLQRTVNKLHQGNEEFRRQNAEMADALKSVRDTTTLLATQNLSPEQVRALEARQLVASERAAALRAAQNMERGLTAYGQLFLDTLKGADIDPADPDIDWARDARDAQEWVERVGPSIQKKLTKTIAERISKAEESIKAKNAAEVKAEAEALAAKQVKELGIDKVDSGQSSGIPTGKSVAEMTDAEFAAYSEQKRQEREQRRIQRLR